MGGLLKALKQLWIQMLKLSIRYHSHNAALLACRCNSSIDFRSADYWTLCDFLRIGAEAPSSESKLTLINFGLSALPEACPTQH
jgi:hypothetical protein